MIDRLKQASKTVNGSISNNPFNQLIVDRSIQRSITLSIPALLGIAIGVWYWDSLCQLSVATGASCFYLWHASNFFLQPVPGSQASPATDMHQCLGYFCFFFEIKTQRSHGCIVFGVICLAFVILSSSRFIPGILLRHSPARPSIASKRNAWGHTQIPPHTHTHTHTHTRIRSHVGSSLYVKVKHAFIMIMT